MRIDVYTKLVLTVIAVCLVWISLGGPSLVAQVHAQPNVQRVVIAGWESSGDRVLKGMPLPVFVEQAGQK
jgi:hypothetical protein